MEMVRIRLLVLLVTSLVSGSLLAYPLPISRFQADGSLYIESSSIVRNQNFVRLMYIENFAQEQPFGSGAYLSKATQVRIDCSNRLVYGISESFYTQADLAGALLGKRPIDDLDGQYAEHGSWVSEVVRVGCSFVL